VLWSTTFTKPAFQRERANEEYNTRERERETHLDHLFGDGGEEESRHYEHSDTDPLVPQGCIVPFLQTKVSTWHTF
jgi:hypothetical protein